MRRISHHTIEPLHGVASTKQIEQIAASQLQPNSLMARAGLAVAQLAQAIAPHARCIWVACGPGNNGGDGLVAATHLHRQALAAGGFPQVVVTLSNGDQALPTDAAHALQNARAEGVCVVNEPPQAFDLAIDALLGIGRLRPPQGRLADHLQCLQSSTAPVLCVDLPSGLDADTGRFLLGSRQQALAGTRHTLSLLTLKPGLFTADGRDQTGQIWLDDLGVGLSDAVPPTAYLQAMAGLDHRDTRPHAAHKGSHGDVLVIGGQHMAVNGSGMTGAAVLAARAALVAGAGRVYLCLLGNEQVAASVVWDPDCPALMLKHWQSVTNSDLLEQATVVCGCGGGLAVLSVLPDVLLRARSLVLDADGLNAVAHNDSLQEALRQRGQRQQPTVLTPHPLEAARLLGLNTADVMADRMAAARALSNRFGTVCVLKGSGSVICAPGNIPRINASGNAALATAGTGDVLAGFIGAALGSGFDFGGDGLLEPVADAVYQHGALADRWVARTTATGLRGGLTADQLTRAEGSR